MFKFFCTPPDGASTEYQISNREFSDFLHTYYCDFLSNVYRQVRFFSVVLMGNVCISCRYCTASKEALLSFLVINVTNSKIESQKQMLKISKLTLQIRFDYRYRTDVSKHH